VLGTRSSIRRARFRSYIDVIKLKDMNLTIEDLKLIRLGLNKIDVNPHMWDTIKKVDTMLAEHNLKGEFESLPRRKYARNTTSKFVFNPINK
jgi:hypothetical protein